MTLERDSDSDPSAARFVVVGCGTVVPEPDRACSCYWVESDASRILLDCGPGSLQAMARLGLPWQRITDIALTHYHADHTGALPGLLFALTYGLLPEQRIEPLDIWGPRGCRDFVHGLEAAFGSFVVDPGFEVRVHETGPDGAERIGEEIVLSARSTPHTEESRALRLELPAATIGYSGDTGPSETLPDFFLDCDLLVCECSLPDSHAIDTHLSPRSAARLAASSDPRLLLLTHIYPQFRRATDVAELVARSGWTGRIEIAREGWERTFLP